MTGKVRLADDDAVCDLNPPRRPKAATKKWSPAGLSVQWLFFFFLKPEHRNLVLDRCDSKFQSGPTVSPILLNDAWRFGAGVKNQISKIFSWGIAAEYAYAGTLDVDKRSSAPVALGGRGDLIGSFENAGIFFFGLNFNWVF